MRRERLEFGAPRWYHDRTNHEPPGVCLFHDRWCSRRVERDMQILHPLPPREKKRKLKKEMMQSNQRVAKRRQFYDELCLGEEAKRQRKRTRMLMAMTLDERRIFEEKENAQAEEEHRRRMIDASSSEDEEDFERPQQDPDWAIKKGPKFTTKNKSRGHRYDLQTLLSSPSRHYLIKNNGDQFDVKELYGKHVVLYFYWLNTYQGNHNFFFDADLEEVYQGCKPKLQVVFVALGNNKKVFSDLFSRIPWLAIPHEDEEARMFFRSIPFLETSRAVLFAPDGSILLKDCDPSFRVFGPQGFPFTKKRMREIERENDALFDKLILGQDKISLNALLGDHLISPGGDQVSTSVLEGKIVGPIQRGVRCDIPWYSLPVDGRKLCAVFGVGVYDFMMDHGDCTDAGYFTILLQDKYQPYSYFSYQILEEFGIDAYPFTLEKAVMIEKVTQQKTIVGELLSPLSPLRRGGSSCIKEDTTVCKLLGKRVLLLFATHSYFKYCLFLSELTRICNEKKRTDDDFEIIYISLDCIESPSSFTMSIHEMPWLVHAHVPDFADSLVVKIFKLPINLSCNCSKMVNLKQKKPKEWNVEYPFIETDMSGEVYSELLRKHNWDLDILKPGY